MNSCSMMRRKSFFPVSLRQSPTYWPKVMMLGSSRHNGAPDGVATSLEAGRGKVLAAVGRHCKGVGDRLYASHLDVGWVKLQKPFHGESRVPRKTYKCAPSALSVCHVRYSGRQISDISACLRGHWTPLACNTPLWPAPHTQCVLR